MALKLTEILPFGYTAEYWVITEYHLSRLKNMAIINLLLFKDEAQRQASFTKEGSIKNERITLKMPDNMTESDIKALTVEQLYGLFYNLIVQQVPKFAGAESVLETV